MSVIFFILKFIASKFYLINIFDNDKVINQAKKMGIINLDKKYELNEIITGDSIFCATGITSGELVSGIKIENNRVITDTLITHKSTGLRNNVLTNIEINAT